MKKEEPTPKSKEQEKVKPIEIPKPELKQEKPEPKQEKSESKEYVSPLPKNSHVMAEHYAKEFIMFEKEFLALKEYSKEIPTDRRAEKHLTLLKYYGLYLQYADKR